MASQISKKRKFVADGVFRAELGEFFTRELAEEGYSGCDVRVTRARTEARTILIRRIPCRVTRGCCRRSSSVLRTPKKFWAKRVDASANSPPSFKNDSNFPKIHSSCTPKRSTIEVCLLLPSVRA
jgi:hypothetical protein